MYYFQCDKNRKRTKTKYYIIEEEKGGRMGFSTVNEWAGRIGKEVPCFHLRPIFSHPQVNDVYR